MQGPPGTGKTWLAKKLGYALLGSKKENIARDRMRVVQFHPSMSYEDFVRGYISVRLVRRLFEKAIRNIYRIELSTEDGWKTYPTEKQLRWPIENQSSRIDEIMPQMRADIIIENSIQNRRIIIDTKFAKIFGKSQYREKTLKSNYIYQLYAYLRSQEETGEMGVKNSQGMLLHPTVGEEVDEYIEMQGHRIRFVTINLVQSSNKVLADLRGLI